MPTLNWIGKEAVVNHDKEVPFRLLKKVKSSSVGDNSQNLIIHGDNLEALKALMPYYQNKIKCIYIDPPYNTGFEDWIYSDRVNSPKIKKWLGKTVGGSSKDLCRHDKWLCMIYPRMKLLKDLLNDEGAIFISVDQNEVHHLRLLLDDVFGEENYIETIIWRKKEGGGQQDDYLVTEHEYVLMYAKNKTSFSIINKKADKNKNGYKLTDESGKRYSLVKLAKWGSGALKEDRPTMHFPIKDPSGKDNYPLSPDGRQGRWRFGKATIEEMLKNKKIEFQKKGMEWVAYEKVYEPEEGDFSIIKQRSIFYDIGTTAAGTNELTDLFGKKDVFPHPKPSDLIAELLSLVCKDGDLILDSFAGSGTTGHAVLKLNKLDKGNRKFVLVEMEDYAKEITSERIKNAIKRYFPEEGFEYCELDKPLFNEEGQIEEECSFEQLATYIYFTETNTNLDKKNISSKLIGEYNDIEYYLLFKEKGKNILSKDFLKKIKKDKRKKIIYADKCLIDDKTLSRYNIQFKQIPYEVKVY